MVRMNVAYWCRVTGLLFDAAAIEPGAPFGSVYGRLLPVVGMTVSNYHTDALIKLSVSEPLAVALVEVVGPIIKDATRTDAITIEEVGKIRKAINDYRPVLEAELQGIDSYYVKQQGAFSTRTLTDNAEMAVALPPDVQPLLSEETKTDLREAGRCLVFQLPTASGFHVARATETVIRALMDAVGCSPLKDSQRNWGNYIKVLQDQDTDAKITHHLEQVKNLHRNPLIHPEVTLTMPEAVALWSICISLIGTMMLEISKLKARTSRKTCQ